MPHLSGSLGIGLATYGQSGTNKETNIAVARRVTGQPPTSKRTAGLFVRTNAANYCGGLSLNSRK
jgi:hypothetical protein